ncbi:MAG: hypothetical protein QGH06_04330 [Lutibacter sp.]|nr:hypothetical protein [Lutibacter sp.]
MKLNDTQIQQLYRFTRAHFVEHFDIQTELVDHLANDIEQCWESHPETSFESAKNAAFKKFGVFGFMDVVEARTKSMSKKYQGIIGRIFLEFFVIPRIALTGLLYTLLYLSLKAAPETTLLTIFLGGFAFLLYHFIKIRKTAKERFRKTQKKWLLEDMIFGGQEVILLLNLIIQLLITNPKVSTPLWLFLYAFSLTSFLILTYILAVVLPAKADTLLRTQYPEYDLA